jgi:NAD(P)-dependent dehydrogenase (short-subunit alcohol dehydrogenase family)
MSSAQRAVSVVTGANRGLGFAVARQLLEHGAHVVLTARDARAGRAAADLLNANGGDADFHPLDVEDSGSVSELGAFLTQRHGHVDLLVNNAGAHPDGDGSAMNVSAAAMMQAFNVNCLGALRVSQELFDLLKRSAAGRIVNVSTILASPSQMDQFPGQFFAYRIAKSALNTMTAGMAVELRHFGISVNAVHPGWMNTRMGGPSAPLSAEEGAASVVHVGLRVENSISGRLFAHTEECSW